MQQAEVAHQQGGAGGAGGAVGHPDQNPSGGFQAQAHAVDAQLGVGPVGGVDVVVHAVATGLGHHAGAAGETDDVAAGIALADGVGAGAGLGHGLVVAGHGVVVVAMDVDAQLGQVVQAQGVGDLVAEILHQSIVGAQALHRRVALVDHIAVAAVSGDGQGAVGADDIDAAAGGHRGQGAGDRLAQGADAGDRLGFAIVDRVRRVLAAIHVQVVIQYVAAGVGTGNGVTGGRVVAGVADIGVVDAAPFGGVAHVIDADRSIVGTLDDHPQGRGVLQGRATQADVRDHVGEVLGQLLAGQAQGLHLGVVVVDQVLVGTVGLDHQPAVAADHLHRAEHRYAHRHAQG